jgi:hypothetical protein
MTFEVCLALILALSPRPGDAAEGLTKWNTALGTYSRAPFHNRRSLLVLRREVLAEVPPIYILALADAQLRAKQFRAAGRSFEHALSRGIGEPWAGWATVGMAWASLAEGDFRTARAQFTRAAGVDGAVAPLGDFAVAYLDAAEGAGAGVEARFASVASDARATDDLRRAARLGGAYARYWGNDYEGAAAAFETLARDPDAGSLRDDASYGAAWARVRAGDREGARAGLRRLAKTRRRGRASRGKAGQGSARGRGRPIRRARLPFLAYRDYRPSQTSTSSGATL